MIKYKPYFVNVNRGYGMSLKLRNLVLGSGRPSVCVPVTESAPNDIIEHIKEITDDADMIEWRLDFFEKLSSQTQIKKTLTEAGEAAGDTPLIVTLRTKAEGGQFTGDLSEYDTLIMQCAACRCADLIDVEYYSTTSPESFIQTLRSHGQKIIVSHHDFSKTPSEGEMTAILEKMSATGAEIVKLAVMPESTEDVLSLLSVTDSFHRSHPDKLLVTMSMGSTGVISRVSGGVFGSCITFGSDRVASAPGQIEFHELKELLRIIEEAGN